MRVACLVIAAVSVAACLLPSRMFSLTLAGDQSIPALPVTLEDRTGLVGAVGPALPGQFNFEEGVGPGADPSDLVVSWLGGACDVATHLVLSGRDDAYTISEQTDQKPGACTLQAYLRTVTIRFATPINPDAVVLTSEPPAP